MTTKTLTISDKGQLVIPKEFVKYLASKLIKLEFANNQEIRIIPIKDVAGSLSKFSKVKNLDDSYNLELSEKN